jgi:hypothetical protein
MKLGKDLMAGLALIGLALGFSAGPAGAQTIVKGTFELPAAAYFGNMLLQAGRYTILTSTEEQNIAHVPIVHVSGDEITATVFAFAQPEKESARNVLDLVNMDGTYVIRAFDVGLIGKTFAFAVTGNIKKKALQASAAPAIEAPVSMGGGL